VLYRFLQFWLQVAFTLIFRLRVIGRENVPCTGGALVASNHQSYLDPMLMGASVQRPLYIMARKSLFQQFFLFTWLIRNSNAFPVERDRGDIGAVRETMRHLREGRLVLTFPESTRTYTGRIGELKRGLFVISGRANVPVVPAVIDGAFESWPRTRLLPRPAKLTVAFGKPLLPSDFGGDADAMAQACHRALEELQERVRLTVAERRGQ
jgi:1-acyl-sn-glycerol-3-phosphate acyltransferase